MHHLVRRHADASFPDFPIVEPTQLRDALIDRIHRHAQAIAQLTNEVAAPRDDRDHLRNRRGNVEASKDECNRLRRDVMRQQSKIADLNSDVAGLQTERERQFADLVLLNLELPKAKGGCARLRQDRTEQARRIKMLRQHIIRIEGQREQLRANMTRLNGQVKAFEGDRNAIRAGTCRQALKATKLDGTTVVVSLADRREHLRRNGACNRTAQQRRRPTATRDHQGHSRIRHRRRRPVLDLPRRSGRPQLQHLAL